MARLLITGPGEETRIFEITTTVVDVGRAESSSLTLEHPSVSRYHARLILGPGNLATLSDLGTERRPSMTSRCAKIDCGIRTASRSAPTSSGTTRLLNRRLRSRRNPAIAARVAKLLAQRAEPASRDPVTRLACLETENKLLRLLLQVDNALSTALTPKWSCVGSWSCFFRWNTSATGGQILASEVSFRSLDGSFKSKAGAPIPIKGHAAPVEVYEILWHAANFS